MPAAALGMDEVNPCLKDAYGSTKDDFNQSLSLHMFNNILIMFR